MTFDSLEEALELARRLGPSSPSDAALSSPGTGD